MILNDPSPEAAANIAVLSQGLELLERMPDELYSRPGQFLQYAIGPQFRHILDHYESLFRGFDHLEVDYERRERNPELESSRRLAMCALESVIARLERLPSRSSDLPLRVRREESVSSSQHWSESCVSRELQFLLSHTVHHYAVIGLIATGLGIEPAPEFGMAPSTLRYRRSVACAH